MTRLILVRHGETDWNREGRFQGQADPPLNMTGREQAKALAEQLAGRTVDAIYSSDLWRAVETAQTIADRLRLKVEIDPRLREVNQGVWEGMRASDIAARYPEVWKARQRDPLHAHPPGGETVAEVATRVWAAADDIARHHPGGSVLIVSHAVALATLLSKASEIPLEQVFQIMPANGRLETLEWS